MEILSNFLDDISPLNLLFLNPFLYIIDKNYKSSNKNSKIFCFGSIELQKYLPHMDRKTGILVLNCIFLAVNALKPQTFTCVV